MAGSAGAASFDPCDVPHPIELGLGQEPGHGTNPLKLPGTPLNDCEFRVLDTISGLINADNRTHPKTWKRDARLSDIYRQPTR